MMACKCLYVNKRKDGCMLLMMACQCLCVNKRKGRCTLLMMACQCLCANKRKDMVSSHQLTFIVGTPNMASTCLTHLSHNIIHNFFNKMIKKIYMNCVCYTPDFVYVHMLSILLHRY